MMRWARAGLIVGLAVGTAACAPTAPVAPGGDASTAVVDASGAGNEAGDTSIGLVCPPINDGAPGPYGPNGTLSDLPAGACSGTGSCSYGIDPCGAGVRVNGYTCTCDAGVWDCADTFVGTGVCPTPCPVIDDGGDLTLDELPTGTCPGGGTACMYNVSPCAGSSPAIYGCICAGSQWGCALQSPADGGCGSDAGDLDSGAQDAPSDG